MSLLCCASACIASTGVMLPPITKYPGHSGAWNNGGVELSTNILNRPEFSLSIHGHLLIYLY